MRLLNTRTGVLKSMNARKQPKYAILSHRWTKDEVTFTDVQNRNLRKSSNLRKFWGCLHQARRDGFHYVWIDTCCIDKQSSTELNEAINSMYRWYQGAESCYVYLDDVDQRDWESSIASSKWFTRGWTLQELLAPRRVLFYDREWRLLGDKKDLARHISRTTGIDSSVLETGSLDGYSVAQKMSWASRRFTTVIEDGAYCLMGIFGVNIPLLYGEGERAFQRLQEEIIKYNDDQTIFAWSMGKKRFCGLLAASPACFTQCGNIVSSRSVGAREPFLMTNRGLSITLKITPWSADTYLAYLDCAQESESKHQTDMGIFLRRLSEDDQYVRVGLSRKGLWLAPDTSHFVCNRPISERRLFVRQTLNCDAESACLETCRYGFQLSDFLLQSSAQPRAVRRSRSDCTALLEPGSWGLVAVIPISSQYNSLSKIALGFDFNFNPVCLLEDSFSARNTLSGALEDHYDWSNTNPDAAEWAEIIEGSRVYRSNDHKGVWALRGHRLRGLDVLLARSFNDRGSLLKLERCRSGSQQVWKLEIDDLVGPFRNYNHEELRTAFGDRRNFQAAYGLDMEDEDIETGDAILKTMHACLILD
ncbi:hypothetical protein MMC13_005913 [Lambiella insularis]|nr:hypothetical protein [Lambiella insularis]